MDCRDHRLHTRITPSDTYWDLCPLRPGSQQWEGLRWRASDRGFDHTLTHHIGDMPQTRELRPVSRDLPTDHLADVLCRLHLHH